MQQYCGIPGGGWHWRAAFPLATSQSNSGTSTRCSACSKWSSLLLLSSFLAATTVPAAPAARFCCNGCCCCCELLNIIVVGVLIFSIAAAITLYSLAIG